MAPNISVESLFTSTWVIVVVVVALLTTGWLPVLLGAIIVGVGLYAVYVVVTGLHERFVKKVSGSDTSEATVEFPEDTTEVEDG